MQCIPLVFVVLELTERDPAKGMKRLNPDGMVEGERHLFPLTPCLPEMPFPLSTSEEINNWSGAHKTAIDNASISVHRAEVSIIRLLILLSEYLCPFLICFVFETRDK